MNLIYFSTQVLCQLLLYFSQDWHQADRPINTWFILFTFCEYWHNTNFLLVPWIFYSIYNVQKNNSLSRKLFVPASLKTSICNFSWSVI